MQGDAWQFPLLALVLDGASLAIIVFAPKIVSVHASMYARFYPDAESRSRLDQMQVFNPLTGYLIGRMSRYAAIGPNNPHAFPRAIAFIRILGLMAFL